MNKSPNPTDYKKYLKKMSQQYIIEGITQTIIKLLHKTFIDDRLDDTEYIRNVKVVIEAVDLFIADNNELIEENRKITKNLYDYSKKVWMEFLIDTREKQAVLNSEDFSSKDVDYYDYYFDYIYNHHTYPL